MCVAMALTELKEFSSKVYTFGRQLSQKSRKSSGERQGGEGEREKGRGKEREREGEKEKKYL